MIESYRYYTYNILISNVPKEGRRKRSPPSILVTHLCRFKFNHEKNLFTILRVFKKIQLPFSIYKYNDFHLSTLFSYLISV